MRIALVTDAWHPQVNGVVRTWDTVTRKLRQLGHDVLVIHPKLFRTVPCPGYPAIRLAIRPRKYTIQLLREFEPQCIHIATEGPVGLVARKYCQKSGLKFTTSYHTHFPHYLRVYYGIPESITFKFMRWFHNGSQATLVPTESVKGELEERRFKHVHVWKRGVDRQLFFPPEDGNRDLIDLPRPIYLNTGRVSHEKNLREFAAMKVAGSKVIVGDGPALAKLRRKFPDVHYTGYLVDEDMRRYLQAADVFVFPSYSDTFGNVMMEALACGTPVAAHKVTGPVDVMDEELLEGKVVGAMGPDLHEAAQQAMGLDRQTCRDYTEKWCWNNATQVLLSHLVDAK
ncbi:MAG: alpha-mannosyltransferase [Phycisphaeraceae bacterium]|nr:alpha-mannosyltransferase [Phycisphaeraceae bacterium]